jgi:hypothetical protein
VGRGAAAPRRVRLIMTAEIAQSLAWSVTANMPLVIGRTRLP